jgi:ParG
MKRLNLNIPEELHTRFKVVCATESKVMTEVLLKLIQDYTEKAEKRKAKQ